jgi:hypothetical protein
MAMETAEMIWATLPNFAVPFPPPRWLFIRESGRTGPPTSHQIPSQFKHRKARGGPREGGGHIQLPRSWENATAAEPAAPPANKAPAEESERPIVAPGPPPGAAGCTRGPAPPPLTPNTCSQPSPGTAPAAPTEGDLGLLPSFGRNSTPFSGRGH